MQSAGILSVTTRKQPVTPPERSFQRVDLCDSIVHSVIRNVLNRITKESMVYFLLLLKHLYDSFGLDLTPESKPQRLYPQTGLLANVGREAKIQSRRRARAQLGPNEAPLCLSRLRVYSARAFHEFVLCQCVHCLNRPLGAEPSAARVPREGGRRPSGPSSVSARGQCTWRCL